LRAQLPSVNVGRIAGKKELRFNVRMLEKDFALVEQASDVLWPRAILSKSAMILGLAKIAAGDAVKSSRRRKP
jgi:hypothetical protein